VLITDITMYTIQIKGMHCNGCKNLITMSLVDEGMTNVFVDEKGGTASFDADSTHDQIAATLDRVFQDLKEYSYSSLTKN
jgi:copper chaperone CopZ